MHDLTKTFLAETARLELAHRIAAIWLISNQLPSPLGYASMMVAAEGFEPSRLIRPRFLRPLRLPIPHAATQFSQHPVQPMRYTPAWSLSPIGLWLDRQNLSFYPCALRIDCYSLTLDLGCWKTTELFIPAPAHRSHPLKYNQPGQPTHNKKPAANVL